MMGYTFISGATGGIGKAFSIECAHLNYPLFLTARSQSKLSELKEDLSKITNQDIIVCACDLKDQSSIDSMLSYIDSRSITFDRIINVAGVDTQKPFTEYEDEKVLMQIKVNVESNIYLTHQLLKRKGERAEIITISSMSGQTPMPYFALYSATKCALTNFYTALHYELKKQGVKVTTVIPGGVYTRPDIVAQIKGQGLWGKLSAKTPAFIAIKSLKKVRKNKVKYIPGFFNRLLNAVMKILPKKIVLSFIARRWKKERKDAF